MAIRTVLIDDEPPSIDRLAGLIGQAPDFEVVGRFSSAVQAARMLPKLSPDAAFIDVQMPRLDGFAVIDRLPDLRRTAIVFVTAHAEFALDAFRVAAIDYLLKPFDDLRFHTALERVRARCKSDVADAPREREEYTKRLAVVSASCTTLVSVNDIHWMEGAGNYVRLHCRNERHLLRDSLTNLMGRLDPRQFVRVHRSAAVRLDRVRSIQSTFGREHILTLQDGTRIRMSPSYREEFESAAGVASQATTTK
jgi:two-component system LytT family response regulator